MKLTHLLGLLIVIAWTVCVEAQIYYFDIISVPSHSQQVGVRQQRQQLPVQRVSLQQQPQQRTVQSQSQKTRARPVRQPQVQGTTIVQQIFSQQQQQQQPNSQRRQQNKTVRQPQTQQSQRQQQSQGQRQVQRQQQSQTHQVPQPVAHRPQQSQKQQAHRQKPQTQRQQQQNHRQQQSNPKQQSQSFKQQTQRQQQSQAQQSHRHITQQEQRPQTQDIVITFPSSSNTQQSQQQREQWSQQQSVPVTFPGVTSRPSTSASVSQNSMFAKPSNPFLTIATSQANLQNHHFSTSDKINTPVGSSNQNTPFVSSTTNAFNNGFNNNFDSGSLVHNNGFINTATTNVESAAPFSGNGFNNFNNVAEGSNQFPTIAVTSSSSSSFSGTVDPLNNPFSSNFGPGTNAGITTLGGHNFDSGADINSQIVGGINGLNGFNKGVSNNAFSTATTISNDNSQVNNGFNEFDHVPVINNANNFNSNSGGFRDRGENFDYNRWFSPHRPQINHYRDFAGIFNLIDQKAESDYNTSTEDDEMHDDFNGRSVVSPGQYPHMAALGYRSATGGTKFKCGGSLISELYVLTAAHCCFLNGQAPHLVRIGDVKLKKFEHNDIPQRRGIARVIKHPYYNDSMYYNDIGLLELANPIVYTYYVRPIRLWARDDIPYDKVFTMGYGSTDFAQAPTNVLTELDLSIVPLDTCNRTMPPDPNAPYGITESQICAKDFEKNRDTCQGDSGGPLQLNLERPRSRRLRYYLVGIISYGTFCRSRYPGIYTRVSSYIDWIASEVWPEYFNNFQ